MTDKGRKRIRKSPEERKREIIKAAVNLVGEKGYYGTSLKEIADEVGMSQPGMLHYIGNKENLLSMLVTDSYDAEGTPDDFIRSGLPGSDRGDLRFPAYLRFLVRYNAQRRSLLQLYIVLESESFSPEHPLHEYFEDGGTCVRSCANAWRPWMASSCAGPANRPSTCMTNGWCSSG